MVFHKVYAIVIFAALFKSGQSFYESSNVISQPSIQTSKASHVSPYTVAIIRDKDWQKRCVGTLISDSLVLTAAQCVDCESAELILGAYDILVSEKTQIRQSIDKSHIIFHPLYDYRTLDNDIALIRLPQKVKITPFVNVVQLPDSDFHVEYGTNAYITGWEHSPNGYSNILSQVELTLISHDKCMSFWPMGRINYSKMCATYSHRHGHLHELLGTECIVDPGSPLTLHGNPDTLIGILTGESTCGSSLPQIFVYVAQYKDWIDAELGRDLRVIEVSTSTTPFTSLELPEEKSLYDSSKIVHVENDKLIEDILKDEEGINDLIEPEVINVNSGQDKIEPVVKYEVVKPENLYQLEKILPQHLEVEPLDYPVLKSWEEIPPLLKIIPQPMDAVQFDYSSLVQLETPLLNLVDIVPQTIYNYPVFGDLVQVSPLYNLGGDIISPSLETILIDSPSSGLSSYNLIGETIPQPLVVSPLLTIGDTVPQSFETSVFDIPLLGDWNLAPPSYTLLGDITYQPIDAGILGYPYNLVGEVIPEPFDTKLLDYPLLGDWNLAPPSYTLSGDTTSQLIDAGLLGYSYNLVGNFIPQPFDITLLDYPLLGDWNLAPPSYTLSGDITSQFIDAGLLGYPLFGEQQKLSPLYSAGGIIGQPLGSSLSDYLPFGNWVGGILPQPLDDALFDYLSLGSLGQPPFISQGDIIHQGVSTIDYPPFGGWEGVRQQHSTTVKEIKPLHIIKDGEITPQLEEVTVQHTESDSLHVGENILQTEDSPHFSDESIILYPTEPLISDVYFEPAETDVTGVVLPDENFDILPEIIVKGDSNNKAQEAMEINTLDGLEGVKIIVEDKPNYDLVEGVNIVNNLEELLETVVEGKPSYGLKEGLEVVIPDVTLDINLEENLKNKGGVNVLEILEDGIEDEIKAVLEEKPNYGLAEGVNIVNNLEELLETVVESKPSYGLKEGLEVVIPDVTPDISLEENLKNKEGVNVLENLEDGLEDEIKAVLEEKSNYELAEGVNIVNNLEELLETVVEGKPSYGLKEGLEVVIPDVTPDISLEENLKNKEGVNVLEILEDGIEDEIKAVLEEKPNYGPAEGVNIVNNLEGALEAVVDGLKEGLEIVIPDVTPDISLEENLKNKGGVNVEILENGLEDEIKTVLGEKPNYNLAEGENVVNNLEEALEEVVVGKPDYGLKEELEVPYILLEGVVENKPSYGLKEGLEVAVENNPDRDLRQELNNVPDVTPEEQLKKLEDGIVTIELHLSDLNLRPDWYKNGKLTIDDLPFKVSENAIIKTDIDPTEFDEEYYV